MVMENIGLKLKLARIEAGISQLKLAELYGSSPQAIRNIEKNPMPSLSIIEKYLKCIGKRAEVVFLPL